MNELITAVFGLLGSGIGSVCGIIASSKLTNWRLEQIEERLKLVDEHTNEIIRLQGRVKELEHEIRDLKGEK